MTKPSISFLGRLSTKASKLCRRQPFFVNAVAKPAQLSWLAPDENTIDMASPNTSHSLQPIRSYHPSMSVPEQVTGDTLDYSTAVLDEGLHRPVINPNDFRRAAIDTLEMFAKSVAGMEDRNEDFTVKLSEDLGVLTVNLGGHGIISLRTDEEHKCISMETPYTGAYNYFLSKDRGEWYEIDHHHSLKGVFVRDLTRVCEGVPKL